MNIEWLFPADEPKVYLIDCTPSKVVALATRGYTGKYDVDISPEEEEEFWRELGDTKLKTPLEFAKATFLITDVTRSFTHQMVRYRTGAYVQESLRFSIQEVSGKTGNRAKVRVPANIANDSSAVEYYCEQAEKDVANYHRLIDHRGVDVQDARSALPIGICTRLFVSMPLNAWAHIYEQRMCCQAQGEEWTPVMRKVKLLLGKISPHYARLLKAPWEDPKNTTCGFGASFDRPCRFRDKFDDNTIKLYRDRFGNSLPFSLLGGPMGTYKGDPEYTGYGKEEA